MAHFAKLGKGNIVERVEVVSNDIATTEQAGIDFLNDLYRDRNVVWKQTSYNNNFRKNYAGIGFQYDQSRDAFIPPKPFNSWILNEDYLSMGSTSCINLMMVRIINGMKQLRIGSLFNA
jgi:hypothetical protein